MNIEDEIKEIAKDFYKYDKIHLNFLLFNDFTNKYDNYKTIKKEAKYEGN